MTPGPRVIVSASGMCEAGRVLYHLQRVLPDPRSTVLVAGYQAEGTLGRRLLANPDEVRVFGRDCPVRADIVSVGGLSGHADHDGLLAQLGPLAGATEKVRLVHGAPDAAESLAAGLRACGFDDVAAARRGEAVTF